MALMKTLRGQILLICGPFLVAGLAALAAANYLAVRSQTMLRSNRSPARWP